MSMKSLFLVLLISFIFVFFLRALIVILHELGHAIPAMLFTKQKVTVYIGSHGKPEKSFNFKIGLLEMWFNYKKFSWRNGVCIAEGNISVNKHLILILCGPLCSSIVALTLYYCFVPEFESSDSYVYMFSYYIKFFLGFSILDLIVNLVPNSKPIILPDGSVTYNDGYQIREIKRLLKRKKLNSKYVEAMDLCYADDFHTAMPLIDYLLKNSKSDLIYRLGITANLQIKNHEKARALSDEFITKFEVNSTDCVSAGLAYLHLGYVKKSILYFEKAMQLDNNNIYALNNLGFGLNLLDRYEEAIPYFDRVVEIKESYFAYTNRGLSKIKTGKSDEGLLDIQKSMVLKENYSFNYRNLGIYHFDIGEFDKALELFLKAKELDPETHMLEELITKTQSVSTKPV
jgi:tetratricopeptide (TPR) repeat protein